VSYLATALTPVSVTLEHSTTNIIVRENDYAVHVMVTWLGAWNASKKTEVPGSQQDSAANAPKPMDTGEDLSAQVPAPSDQSDSVAPVQAPPSTDSMEGVNIPACQNALLAIRQMMWFNDHGLTPNIRSVIKLMMDFRNRTSEAQALSPWALEVVSINAMRSCPVTASISQSLRSVFAYIASGIVLPGIQLIDPCQHGPVNVLKDLTSEQRIALTTLSQEIIKEVAFGNWNKVIGPVQIPSPVPSLSPAPES